MNNQTATSFWDIPNNLNYNEPVDEKSHFFVDTSVARGNFSFNRIYKSLHLDPVSLTFKGSLPSRVYQLFFGHRGCGKSTELLRLSHKLHDPKRFFVIVLDVHKVLGPDDVHYVEILLALASALLEKLENTEGITISEEYLEQLSSWFDERVEKHESTKEFAASIKTGMKAETGLPFIAKIFAAITTSFLTKSTYNEEVRTVVKNSFSQFSAAFNALISAVNEQVESKGLGRCLLFLIDNTDKLDVDTSRRLFIDDAYQLQQIYGNFIYSGPIYLRHKEGQLHDTFSAKILPMIKLREKYDPERLPTAYAIMRQMTYRRIDSSLFDSDKNQADTIVNFLIEHSGGNPRHLIRLLDYTFQEAEGENLDWAAAEKAVRRLASELRRILDTTDYSLLKKIDGCNEEINNDRVRELLFHLALLEYNDYWRLSHPAVRTLDAYKNATPTA